MCQFKLWASPPSCGSSVESKELLLEGGTRKKQITSLILNRLKTSENNFQYILSLLGIPLETSVWKWLWSCKLLNRQCCHAPTLLREIVLSGISHEQYHVAWRHWPYLENVSSLFLPWEQHKGFLSQKPLMWNWVVACVVAWKLQRALLHWSPSPHTHSVK